MFPIIKWYTIHFTHWRHFESKLSETEHCVHLVHSPADQKVPDLNPQRGGIFFPDQVKTGAYLFTSQCYSPAGVWRHQHFTILAACKMSQVSTENHLQQIIHFHNASYWQCFQLSQCVQFHSYHHIKHITKVITVITSHCGKFYK